MSGSLDTQARKSVQMHSLAKYYALFTLEKENSVFSLQEDSWSNQVEICNCSILSTYGRQGESVVTDLFSFKHRQDLKIPSKSFFNQLRRKSSLRVFDVEPVFCKEIKEKACTIYAISSSVFKKNYSALTIHPCKLYKNIKRLSLLINCTYKSCKPNNIGLRSVFC